MKAQESIDKLNAQMEADIAALEGENKELRGAIDVLEHKVAGLQARCDVLDGALRLCQDAEARLSMQVANYQALYGRQR